MHARHAPRVVQCAAEPPGHWQSSGRKAGARRHSSAITVAVVAPASPAAPVGPCGPTPFSHSASVLPASGCGATTYVVVLYAKKIVADCAVVLFVKAKASEAKVPATWKSSVAAAAPVL